MIAIILDWQKMSRDARFAVTMPSPTEEGREAARAAAIGALKAGHFRAYEIEADTLDAVFETLNIAHPEGYDNRSMSVGDIILNGEENPRICLPFGWAALPLPADFVMADVPVTETA